MDADRRDRLRAIFCRSIVAGAAGLGALAGCGGRVSDDGSAFQETPEEPGAGLEGGVVDPVPEPPDAGPDTGPPPDTWGKVEDRATNPIAEIDLGDVAANTEVSFTVPAYALGFNVGIQATTPSDDLAVLDVTSPAASAVIASSIVYKGDHETTVSSYGDVAAAGVPGSNHPDSMPAVKAGAWTAKFSHPGRGTVRIQSTPDGQFHGGYVDMHVYLPEGLDIDGDVVTPSNYAKLQGARDRLDALAKVMRPLYGLDRGNVTFHLVAASWVRVEREDLGDLFALTSVGGDGQALHVFMVEPTPKQSWWGIASGLPGLANVAGTTESAIALAVMDDASTEGPVLAHEMGHFFFPAQWDPKLGIHVT